jgi:hypothetical protein
MARLLELGGTLVLVAGPDDRALEKPLDLRRIKDLVSEAHTGNAGWLAVRVADLPPGFFDLNTGVAGDILQATVTYRLALAIVGRLPEPAASSNAFAALVRESNRGRDHWFASTLEELADRLAAGNG